MTSGNLNGVRDLVDRHIEAFGKFLSGRTTFILLLEARHFLGNLVQGANLIERQTHYSRLLGKRLQNRLADPPHGIRDKFETARFIKFLSRANQAQVSLVDQVGKTKALVLVLFCHRHHEAQICPCKFV